MAYAKLIGKDDARKVALASIDALEQKFAANVQILILEVDTFIKSVTPVNTGQAVRNYCWTRGVANMETYAAIDNGPPGPTNSMALGSEPRRAPNEAAAFETLLALDVGSNPFDAFYLANNSPDIEGLELGIYPGPPLKSRSPSGMFGITSAYANMLVASKGMLS
jgi:hypothetical protein